ncbi:RNA 2'-phosphotransferase [Mucilaginibacter conchicola]|uniref:Probable RNA 2'-phosphotransferase n=1 Tax=Mucilaginibacter conchicola TaxID=2303333 RepID=A0A372NNZ3_9SPHI|nr:RNA 2'-phosphotransferase [Mucilaginibacter conchicola]RFZ90669.1 RNA 2'-phosphotransferase [Mucilaginibacter conchicola]
MKTDNKQISKLISYWLRHAPEDGNLTLDDYGWTGVESVIAALAAKGQQATKDELIELSASFDKIRWQFDETGDRIRATHGHSVPVLIVEEPTTPPDVLYHGSKEENKEAILAEGLRSMSRRFLHLSATRDMAVEVGQRHGKVIVFLIDAKQLHHGGHKFYNTSENVWLCDAIPADFVKAEK